MLLDKELRLLCQWSVTDVTCTQALYAIYGCKCVPEKKVALLSLIEWLHGPAAYTKSSRHYASLQAVSNMHERAMRVVGAFHLIGLTCRSNIKHNRCLASNLYMNKPDAIGPSI